MPAKIDLLPRKEFDITLEDGAVIKGQFGTWCLKRFCDRQKITLSQFANMKADEYSFSHIVDMILSAVEHSARKEKRAFGYTDVDACDWIDQMGGPLSSSLTELFNHQVSENELKDAPEDIGEKKTNLPGLASPVSSIQLEEA